MQRSARRSALPESRRYAPRRLSAGGVQGICVGWADVYDRTLAGQ